MLNNEIVFDFVYIITNRPEKNQKNETAVLDLEFESEFTIQINDSSWFKEELFFILEFVYQLNCWLKKRYIKNFFILTEKLNTQKINDFEYFSMEEENDDIPVITFKNVNNGFLVYSPYQLYQENKIIPYEVVFQTCESFLSTFKTEELDKYGILLQ